MEKYFIPNFIYFLLICIPLATIVFLAARFLLFFKKEKKEYIKPELKVFSSVVSKEFTEKFKSWDSHLAKNLKVIG